MKFLSQAAVLTVLAAGLAGCSGNNANSDASPAASATSTPATGATASAGQQLTLPIKLEIDRTDFSLKQWKVDGSHTTSVKGKLLLGDKPVAKAVLHAGTSKKDIMTADDGTFELLVDQSLLADTQVHVTSLDEASVDGQPLGSDAAQQIMNISTYISVYYPIEVTKTEASATDADQVDVHARIVSDKGDIVSFFQVDKYRIGGKVLDASGQPLKDAVVWIDRDEGEGFAKSTPTDDQGEYQLFYLPEEDEGTNLTVTIGTKRYTLPENKVFHIPEDTSVEINITLPKEGTTIDDKPPTLVSQTSPGAMYTGILAGVNVPEGTNYTVTIPDKDGNFVVTLPKSVWEAKPSFFETKLTKFVEEGKLTWGDKLPSGFLQPGQNDPKNIAAVANGM